jgi:hypothetical protein
MRVINLWTMRSIDMSSVAGSQSDEHVMVKAVDCHDATSGEILVRVHSGTIGGTAQFDVIAVPTQPSAEDPSRDFLATAAVGTASIVAADVTGAPRLVRATLTAPFGANLMFKIKGTQPSAQQTLQAVLSADAVFKD